MTTFIKENFQTIFKYKPLKIGNWWSNKEQIDLVAYDDATITFIALEHNASSNVKSVYEELKTKSNAFETVLTKKNSPCFQVIKEEI